MYNIKQGRSKKGDGGTGPERSIRKGANIQKHEII